jgi:hypothetical protein
LGSKARKWIETITQGRVRRKENRHEVRTNRQQCRVPGPQKGFDERKGCQQLTHRQRRSATAAGIKSATSCFCGFKSDARWRKRIEPSQLAYSISPKLQRSDRHTRHLHHGKPEAANEQKK